MICNNCKQRLGQWHSFRVIGLNHFVVYFTCANCSREVPMFANYQRDIVPFLNQLQLSFVENVLKVINWQPVI